MATFALGKRLLALLRDDLVRTLLLLAVALLAALVSIVSFLFGEAAGGSPTRLQMGLLVFALFMTWYVALQATV